MTIAASLGWLPGMRRVGSESEVRSAARDRNLLDAPSGWNRSTMKSKKRSCLRWVAVLRLSVLLRALDALSFAILLVSELRSKTI